jgi:hypothetical protein
MKLRAKPSALNARPKNGVSMPAKVIYEAKRSHLKSFQSERRAIPQTCEPDPGMAATIGFVIAARKSDYVRSESKPTCQGCPLLADFVAEVS